MYGLGLDYMFCTLFEILPGGREPVVEVEAYPQPWEGAWHAFSAGGSTQTLCFDFTQG